MSELPDPTPELREFMQKGTIELFEIIMMFCREKSDQLPDEPQIVNTSIGSIVCATVAFFLGYRFSNMEKKDIFYGSELFCDSVLKNVEALIERTDFQKIVGKDEMDKDNT